MLTIGEFSKLCKVSSKTLRYYDSIDLIKPAWINKENEYRYYSIDQLEKIYLINKLKEYQFPLIEILNILNKNDDNYLKACIIEKQEYIRKQIERQNDILKQMQKDINIIESRNKFINICEDIKINIINTEPISILSIRRFIKEGEEGELFNELIPLIEGFKLHVYDKPISIYHNKEYVENSLVDMEMGVPVEETDNKYIRTLEGSLCIYTKYVGSYQRAQFVYNTLYKWKEEQNYEVIAPSYQKYIKGASDTDNPDEYITEIYIPVRKKYKIKNL
ncbi:MerR family transcriptional regulator [Clostridium paridis]|uniref:MerR family transcriptional regulator n=1 Tax=Clostridium paridis TaxID=2803863 RepID=A0A937FHD6_9CLOT|nr:MerR family transcriptional regulator [Clostridium paridis]MBL4932312.1 MerR family transcriptional regulator [Clostridium paridis]